MKLHNEALPVETSGVSETSSFSIAMNAKAFRVLSDTLYMNKIGSIVREISCNAYDAHVMANKKDIPFEIHLPNAFEPWFAVRDFGTGLTPEDIRTVFTVYFQSTKDQSNDAIGAFGLGAKTPFAYTDQFTVTSIVDGVRYIYSAFISQSGVPDIALMDESKTAEGNGVEIKMSAKREDFYRFSEEVRTQLLFFTVKPMIINGTLAWPTLVQKWTFESDDGSFVFQGGLGKKIIQGNVGYDLDVEKLSSSSVAQNYTDSINFLRVLHNHSLLLKFKIGQIGVTASREGIEYDDKTVENILKTLNKLRVDFANNISNEVSKHGNMWDIANYIQSDPLIYATVDHSKYLSVDFIKNSNGRFTINLKRIRHRQVTQAGYAGNVVNTTTPEFTISRMAGYAFNNKRTRVDCGDILHIQDASTVVILVRDKNTLAERKIQEITKQYSKTANMLFYEVKPCFGTDTCDTIIKNLRTTLKSDIKIIKFSEIELPESEKVTTTRSAPSNFYYFTSSSYPENTIRSSSWTANRDLGVDKIKDQCVYLVHDGYGVGYAEFNKVIQANKSLDKPLEIIAISQSKVNKAIENTNLMTSEKFLEYVSRKAKESEGSIKKYLRLEHTQKSLNSRFNGIIEILNPLDKDADVDNDLLRINRFRIKVEKRVRSMENIAKNYRLKASVSDIKIDYTDIDNKMVIVQSIIDKYPLLKICSNWGVREKLKPGDIKQYILAIDNLTKGV